MSRRDSFSSSGGGGVPQGCLSVESRDGKSSSQVRGRDGGLTTLSKRKGEAEEDDDGLGWPCFALWRKVDWPSRRRSWQEFGESGGTVGCQDSVVGGEIFFVGLGVGNWGQTGSFVGCVALSFEVNWSSGIARSPWNGMQVGKLCLDQVLMSP